ncbi:MAG: DNA repair helicase XPB [Gemmatimonadota bacterium]
MNPDNPLIVQSDHTILVEVASPHYAAARDALLGFAELVKSPEHVHTYRLTPLSIWNACAAGRASADIVDALRAWAKYPVPQQVEQAVRDFAARYGRLKLVRDGAALRLECDDAALAEQVSRHRDVAPLLGARDGSTSFRIDPALRGRLKLALVRFGWPAEDLAGYVTGEALRVELRDRTPDGAPFALRDYQTAAADAFHAGGADSGGSGVIVLPCGAGKTIVGLGCMARLNASTLILTTGVTAAQQWSDELLSRTSLTADDVGIYHGASKEIRRVTIATYQILTHRRTRTDTFTHLGLFDERDWGLIIYDEVHLLPAPVFQVTATLQARRRLGLTATLVREDGREDDVFALIGPKKADVPWKVLERQGWIAKASCTEVRVRMSDERRMDYAVAEERHRFRVAAENPAKSAVVEGILAEHTDKPALIIGMYVEQLRTLAAEFDVPVLTGATPQRERDRLYAAFRAGDLPVLAVSKVANFAVDLPDAAVAIQVSGTFGSRQEEAQRLGRILRPKAGTNQAHFYTIVSQDTVEQEFALKRQLFLCEQGYAYTIIDAEPVTGAAADERAQPPALRLIR